ncbi:DUF177 domain-containing protein [Evansella sp. AB-rgal1]|uniref:YceD family protein n=1 Tax=Evansella sp. AB-rgal1 TaxID=3242696 RepID=UPI00359DC31A
MKWSVQQLLANKGKGLHIDQFVNMEEVRKIDREIREISPIKVVGDAYFSNTAVTFQLTIEGTMTLPCARTLNDVEFPFTIDATEIFQLDQWATFENDEDVHVVKDNTVDLLPYVRERILLEKPLRVFSDKDEGAAPASGNGWELHTKEEEEQEKVDPRLQELAKFFDKEK